MQGSLRGNKGPRIRHVVEEGAPFETITVDKVTPIIGAEIAGIETVGPIDTVGAGAGQTWPTLPVGLAQMPRGGVVNPASPYLSVPSLRSTGELPVRVVNLSSGRDDMVWSGVP